MKDKKPKKYYHLKPWEIIVIVGLVLFAFTAPYLFTQFSMGPSFENSGEIGDTIGGLTAPFINLAAGFLVYKSFTAQIQANLDQRRNHDKQMRLIRKEQALSSLSYLFKEIESIIDDNEEKHKATKGTIRYMIRTLESFDIALNNTERPNYQEYIKRKERLIANQLGKSISVVGSNINHLKVLTNHVLNFNDEFFDENNTAELTNFFTYKIRSIIKKLDCYQLNKKPLCNLEEKLSFEDPTDIVGFMNSRKYMNEVFEKLETLSIASLI
ncbi:MAG: hypothetical protein ACTHOM_08915 [Allomuricauda sp.]